MAIDEKTLDKLQKLILKEVEWADKVFDKVKAQDYKNNQTLNEIMDLVIILRRNTYNLLAIREKIVE